MIKSFKLLNPTTSLKQAYHPTKYHSNKKTKYNSKENPDYCVEAQVYKGKDFATMADFLFGSTPHPRTTVPISFAMVSGGAGAPSVNSGDHKKQNSA
eukprot:14465998-Ditylum_brightwellii.AAC.2